MYRGLMELVRQQKMIPQETQRYQKHQISMLSHLRWQLSVCTHSLIEVEFRSDARKNDIRMNGVQNYRKLTMQQLSNIMSL